MKISFRHFIAIVILVLAAWYGIRLKSLNDFPQFTNSDPRKEELATASATSPMQLYTVRRVIDGDTIELSDGRKVRYIGIDTPELHDPRLKIQCFGKEAAEFNKRLVEGKQVRMEKDVSETDKYGRLLRYVYLPAGRQGVNDVFVNEYLVRQGYANVATFSPDVKFVDQFRVAEKEARENKRGLWGSIATCDT